MTTTAHEDQFTVAPEPVRQPYDTSSILRRNVADLELELKQQAERAEAAEAELLAVREDNHSMMVEIDGLRKELARLREQVPLTFVHDPNGYAIGGTHTEIADALPVGTDLYARPISVPAPAVPEECQHCKKAWEMAPVAWYRKRSDCGVDGPLMDDDSRMCAVRRKEWNPLYERPFYPDFLNYRQGFNDGIEEIRYELKQLCKDFSDLQNRPYMGDVHAQVDAICERALLQSASTGDPK